MTATPAPTVPTLMVVDEDPQVRAQIESVASSLGFAVLCPATASWLSELCSAKPDGAVVDVSSEGGDAVLRDIAVAAPECHIILTTSRASVEAAIAAIKEGALDYVSKPFEADRLRDVLVTVRKRVERRETFLRLDADVAKQFEFYGMVGRGPVMQELFDTIRRVAPHVRTVLVTGETGTGKELVAKALHRLGPRKDKRLITVNCSAVVDTLFESELFGHMRGAFTGATETKLGLFEHASGGTVFLDEIGELPLGLQAKLLRTVEYGEVQRVGALETRRIDVCVIAATNRDLVGEAATGRFRSDLYYRLAILELHLVPLRDRREDIPYLTAVFIRDCAERLKRPIVGITPAAERLLQLAAWPGNVRQLRHVIERACLMSDGRMLTERELARGDGGALDGHSAGTRAGRGVRAGQSEPALDGRARSDRARPEAGSRQ